MQPVTMCHRHGDLMLVLVLCVCAGKGVTKDAQSALSYYGMAFDLGHWKAPYALGQLYAGDECK